MSDQEESSNSSSQESSASEGEYVVEGDDGAGTPKFDFSSWKPEAPAGLQFLSLLPVGGPLYEGYQIRYPQDSHVSKMRVAATHRQARRREFASGKTIGRDIIDEKKLRNAVNFNDILTAQSLLTSGVDPCCTDEKKRSALHFAASKGSAQMVSLLLDHGADPNQKDTVGNTPLHLAACTTHMKVITLLLKAGADVHSLDNSGRTPLHLARSRLRILQQDPTYTSDQLKSEVTQIVEMLRTYLSLAGQMVDASELDGISDQLQSTTTRDEVDAISQLLQDFTSLTIQKEKQPG